MITNNESETSEKKIYLICLAFQIIFRLLPSEEFLFSSLSLSLPIFSTNLWLFLQTWDFLHMNLYVRKGNRYASLNDQGTWIDNYQWNTSFKFFWEEIGITELVNNAPLSERQSIDIFNNSRCIRENVGPLLDRWFLVNFIKQVNFGGSNKVY